MELPEKIAGLEKREHIAIITVPAFDTDRIESDIFAYEFAELCAEIEADEDVRVVIIASPEPMTPPRKNAATEPLSSENNSTASFRLSRTAESIASIDRPTLVAIGTDAVGQGLELALACDIRIASESSRFGFPHIHEGLIPCNGGTQRLPRLIGKGRALQMILTGELIDAKEALRTGLVNIVQPHGDVMKKALELAHDMTTKAPLSLRFTREAIYKGMDLTLDQGLTMEGDLYLLLFSTQDRVEGIEAFKKKRDPSFKGK
jgi:enoyl-CoA hydratase/carnithine racemase